MPRGRAALVVVMLVLMVVSVGLVVVSPWGLAALSDNGLDWNRLSNVGQTYGVVSAIVAAVALLGVAASLVIQSREAKAARLNAHRGYHAELMRMAMDDPGYMKCWGPYLTDSFTSERQFTYVNLIVAQWYAEYQIGQLGDTLLRVNAISVFSSVPGRTYWAAAGTTWRTSYSGRRAERFHSILDDAYREAVKQPPSKPPPESPATQQPARSKVWQALLGAAVGGVAVAVGLWVARWVQRAKRGE
jgi:hypothetical protein